MKNRKNILKEAVILLIATVMVSSTISVAANTKETKNAISIIEKPLQMGRDILFEDSFENYTDFVIDFPPSLCYIQSFNIRSSIDRTCNATTYRRQICSGF
jgi:hypothetical protein